METLTDARSFDIAFSKLDWLSNSESTRWFLALRINTAGSNELKRLLGASNKVALKHGLPPLYAKKNNKPALFKPGIDWDDTKDASDAFHISIGWTLEPPTQNLQDSTRSMAAMDLLVDGQGCLRVEGIKAKVGNIVTDIPLKMSVVEGKWLV